MELDDVPVVAHGCPECGHTFTPDDSTRKRAVMAWSKTRGHYVRVLMTSTEWTTYDQKGSVD